MGLLGKVAQTVGDVLTGTQRQTDDKGHEHIVQVRGGVGYYEEKDANGKTVVTGNATIDKGGWNDYTEHK